MSTKLDWVYQDHARVVEYRAEYKGIVIRAIHDQCPINPFEEEDGHWPMLAFPNDNVGGFTTYDKLPGLAVGAVLGRFNDHALIHDQKAIGAILNVTADEVSFHADIPPRKWWTDADALRSAFEDALYDMSDSDRFDALEALYKLLGIPVLNTTVHGYSQGDQTDLLIVATPEAQKELRSQPADMDDETWARTLKDDMEGQAKLYKAWAFGDVYGYQLARKQVDTYCPGCFARVENGLDTSPCCSEETYTEENLDDIEEGDTSCWGYYGSDFDWSGLEEAAIEAAEGFVKETVDG